LKPLKIVANAYRLKVEKEIGDYLFEYSQFINAYLVLLIGAIVTAVSPLYREREVGINWQIQVQKL
jgi:hypothetical protein